MLKLSNFHLSNVLSEPPIYTNRGGFQNLRHPEWSGSGTGATGARGALAARQPKNVPECSEFSRTHEEGVVGAP